MAVLALAVLYECLKGLHVTLRSYMKWRWQDPLSNSIIYILSRWDSKIYYYSTIVVVDIEYHLSGNKLWPAFTFLAGKKDRIFRPPPLPPNKGWENDTFCASLHPWFRGLVEDFCWSILFCPITKISLGKGWGSSFCGVGMLKNYTEQNYDYGKQPFFIAAIQSSGRRLFYLSVP